jgi:Icc-related predicted phosphoesterase
LAASDIHGNYKPLVDYLKENSVDLVVLAGDITNFGPPELGEEILNEISSYEVPVLAIPGNCDPISIHGKIDCSNAINIHGRGVVIKNLGICGFGGSNPTPFNTPLEFEEVEIYSEARKAMESIKDQKITLMVTHTPPYGTEADLIGTGDHVGSKSLRKVIEEFQPSINICGHVHESCATDKIGVTSVVNVGNINEGNACIIEISDEDEKPDIKIDLIEF